jgi:hypothetical protein
MALLALMLLDAFTAWRWVTLLNGAALFVASGLYVTASKGAGRWFAAIFAGGNAALALGYGIPVAQILAAATTGGQVLGLLLLVEVLGAAVEGGRYDAVLTGLLIRGKHSKATLRRAVSVGSCLLNLGGMFMGSVPAAFFALGGKPGRDDLPLAVAASRGFAASNLINPTSPLLVLAIAGSGAPLLPYLAYAFPLSALLLLLDWFTEPRGATTPHADSPPQGRAQDWRWGQILAFSGAVFTALLVYRAARALGVVVLPRIGVAVSLGALVLGLVEPSRFGACLRALPRNRFASHAVSVPFFALGASFGTLLVSSGLLTPVLSFISRLHAPPLEFPLVMALLLVLRWLGLAPVIGVMILGPIFATAVSLPPPLYALSLTVGAIVAFLGSPLSGTNLFVASVSGLSPLEVSVRIQGWYVATAAVLASLYAVALTRWLI